MNDDQRADFESWYEKEMGEKPYHEKAHDIYKPVAGLAWSAWQAAIESPEVQELYVSLKALLEQDDHGENEIWVRNKARAALAAMDKQK